MPDIWMDVDTAIIVPVNKVPIVLKSDGTTIDEDIVYNEAGISVVWNFVTTAGVMTATAITPTTGGDYDWAEVGTNFGMYSIEITASGGASVDNDTEGFGWITGETTAALAFAGPVIGFRAAALNNALIDGGDTLDVNVTAMAANVVTASAIAAAAIDNATFAADVGSTAYATNIIALAVQKALVEYKLDHLVHTADADDVADDSIVAKLANSGATADWSAYVNTTDSLQAIRDHVGDGTNLTEAGGTGDHLTNLPNQTMDITGTVSGNSTHSAADVVNEWETQSQADPTGFHVNVLEVSGVAEDIATSTEIGALNDISIADVETGCDNSHENAIPTTPTADSINDYIQRTKFVMVNKMEVTEANGNTTIYKDNDSTVYATVAAAYTSDATTTVRKRLE